MINVEHTLTFYSGKLGCMCGCNGSYNSSERSRKLAINRILKDKSVQFQTWNLGKEGCLFVETETRNNVLYLTMEGIEVIRTMNIVQEKSV